MDNKLSIIIPALNEAASLRELLPAIRTNYPEAEILVVDDGSRDDTLAVCAANGVTAISHHYTKGNGAAIKSGARNAQGDVIVCMDADGQHRPDDIRLLLEQIDAGYDMAVGARSGLSQASIFRHFGNGLYNRLASWMVGQRVLDLTSGFRAVRAAKFKEFLHLLPNGFSYPSTITMAFFKSGYSVAYLPIEAGQRIGNSHLRLFRDGARFFLIIFKVGVLYSPFKLFMPISLFFTMLGILNYLYTIVTAGMHFTNMTALMFVTSILVFLIGLVSEQITMLLYKRS